LNVGRLVFQTSFDEQPNRVIFEWKVFTRLTRLWLGMDDWRENRGREQDGKNAGWDAQSHMQLDAADIEPAEIRVGEQNLIPSAESVSARLSSRFSPLGSIRRRRRYTLPKIGAR
jgi:hypothetical protein